MLAALTVALIGTGTTLASVLAQTTGGEGGFDSIAPFVQSTALTAVVGALVYMARQMVNGNLVAKPVAQVQTETAALLQASFKREEMLATIHADSQRREESLGQIVDRTAQTLGRANAVLERMETG